MTWRTEDDNPPAPHTANLTLGKHWKVEATDDGCLLFSSRTTHNAIKVGFDSLAQVFEFLSEAVLAGDAYRDNQEYESTRPRVDWFQVMADAQRSGPSWW